MINFCTFFRRHLYLKGDMVLLIRHLELSFESVDVMQVRGSATLSSRLVVSFFFSVHLHLCLLCCVEDNTSFKYGGRIDSLVHFLYS